MNEPGKVYESFEDALFRLILDRVAVVEGERLLHENEALKNSPEAAVPEDVQKRCLKAALSCSGRKNAGRAAQKVIRAAALAALIALLLGVVAFAIIPAFKAGVMNVLLKRENDQVDWEYVVPDGTEPVDIDSDRSITLDIPDEYYYAKHAKDDVHESFTYISEDDPTLYFQILVIHGSEMSISTDTENVDYYEEFLINNRDTAIVTEKNQCLCISWIDSQKEDYISILTNDPHFSVQQMVEVATHFHS